MYRAAVIDDEDIIVQGLVRTLPWAKYGCEVAATASDGAAALAMLRREKPDLIFTDIRMPGVDGLAVLAAVRSEFPDMQVTILSGYPDFEYAQRAIELGVVRYVLKPSRFADLEDALRAMSANLDALAGERAAQPPQEDAPPAAGSGAEQAQNFIVRNAEAYIRAHHAEKLTLGEVADHVYVSQWHLSKLIARYTGQSFFDLLNGVRIERARELLANPALRVFEISEQVGFADVTHFSRIFKKLTGVSANEYRAGLQCPQKRGQT